MHPHTLSYNTTKPQLIKLHCLETQVIARRVLSVLEDGAPAVILKLLLN